MKNAPAVTDQFAGERPTSHYQSGQTSHNPVSGQLPVCRPYVQNLSLSLPTAPFLANFRGADHTLETDSFIQRVTFHLRTLAISRMTIHGRIVDLKNGKKCFDQSRCCRGQSSTVYERADTDGHPDS